MRRITADTLVVIGDEDMLAYHGHATTLGSVVPRCRLHQVPGARHLCLLERAAEVAPSWRLNWPREAPGQPRSPRGFQLGAAFPE